MRLRDVLGTAGLGLLVEPKAKSKKSDSPPLRTPVERESAGPSDGEKQASEARPRDGRQ
jgi:hypothetical protein